MSDDSDTLNTPLAHHQPEDSDPHPTWLDAVERLDAACDDAPHEACNPLVRSRATSGIAWDIDQLLLAGGRELIAIKGRELAHLRAHLDNPNQGPVA